MLIKPTFGTRILFFVASDIVLSAVSLYFAYLLRFNFAIPPKFLDAFWNVYLVLILCRLVSFSIFKIYFRSWRYFSLHDFKRLFFSSVAAYSAFMLIYLTNGDLFSPMPRSAVIIDFILSMMMIGGLRISKRLVLESVGSMGYKRSIVIGATARTSQVIKSAFSGEIPYRPVAVFDRDSDMAGTYMESVRVYAFEKLEDIARNKKARAALIAEQFEPEELDTIVERLNSIGIREIKMVSLLAERNDQLKDIDIEDLLARQPKDLDIGAIRKFIRDRAVLVSGAGGSIGSEICRQALHFGAKYLVMVDNSEYNLYQIAEKSDPARSVPKLVSVLDRPKLKRLFETYRPDIVIHAAAYKHVPLCEENIEETIKNNILGVKNIIDLSVRYGVEKVVNISSDKAVRPTSVMGATKRMGELYAQNIPSGKTEIVSVRFGNVLGSSGSVVPKFKEQILKGGPITVTHPDVTRYFMLIPEACQLVLQAAAMAEGGELFVLDMGKPVKIVDLAAKMIQLSGKEGKIDIKFIGLRPGEKLFEELLLDESEQKTKYKSIFIAQPTYYDFEKLKADIRLLLHTEDKISVLKRIVPAYTPRSDA